MAETTTPPEPPPKKKHGILFRIVRILVLSLVGVCLFLMIFEDSMIYFPAKHPEGYWDTSAVRAGIEDVWVEVAPGTKVHGWWVPGDAPASGTILFSHGNAGNLTHRGEHLQELARKHFNVLIYDYEGYGRSDGSPNEDHCTRDGLAMFDHLTVVRKVPAREIIIFGESIGGGISMNVAVAHPEAAGLVLQCAFTTLPDVAAIHYPFIPVRLIARTKFDNHSKIATLKIPVRIEHGTDDEIVPYSQAERNFAAAHEPKELVKVQGAGHNDLIFVAGEPHFAAFRLWADKVLKEARERK